MKAAIAAVTLLAWIGAARGDQAAVDARRIAEKWQPAVITVRMTSRERMVVGGREMDKGEQVREGTGAIVDSAGLTVFSLNDAEPFGAEEGGYEEPGYQWDTEISDVKMIMADAREIAASVVMRDRDLDLVFVRPSQKQPRALPFIDIKDRDSVAILDQIVLVGRLGKMSGRVTALSIGRVRAIVRKPRLYYVPDLANSYEGLGRPVFSLNGKVVGLVVFRSAPPRSTEGGETIVLPIEEISEVVSQVPASRK